jgi:hypothetical protein
VAFSDPIDLTPPDTTITGGPASRTTKRTAAIRFVSSEPGSSFACAVDGAAFKPCSAPLGLSKLKLGEHTIAVRATDASGNTDPTPATRTWTIVKRAKLSALRVKPRSFLAQPFGPTITKKKKRGAFINFKLTAEATVVFRIQRAKRNAHGRLVWKALHGKRSILGANGKNHRRFTGRWHSHTLKPGRYRLVARPKPGPKKHAAKRAKFRIKRP